MYIRSHYPLHFGYMQNTQFLLWLNVVSLYELQTSKCTKQSYFKFSLNVLSRYFGPA